MFSTLHPFPPCNQLNKANELHLTEKEYAQARTYYESLMEHFDLRVLDELRKSMPLLQATEAYAEMMLNQAVHLVLFKPEK